MGTGIWANFHWENGIWVTGTGNSNQINKRTGTGIWESRENNREIGNGMGKWVIIWHLFFK